MLEERDPFDYVLAEALGKSLYEVRQLSNYEHVEWRAFYEYRNAMREVEGNG